MFVLLVVCKVTNGIVSGCCLSRPCQWHKHGGIDGRYLACWLASHGAAWRVTKCIPVCASQVSGIIGFRNQTLMLVHNVCFALAYCRVKVR